MEMTWPWDRFENDKALGSGRREDLPRFQDHIATEKELQIKKFKENQKKKKGPKIGVLHCSFITRLSKAALISHDSALVAGGAIGVLIKSLLLVFEKSHNLVFS